MPLDLARLAANDELVECLGWSFDLRIDIELDEPAWFNVEGVSKLEPVGREGAGGLFVRLPDARILYASSEGEAGIIAADLDALLQLVAAHPYWKDLLRFSGKGQLPEMRRAAIALEAMTLSEQDDLEDARAFVRTELGLAEPGDTVAALHQAVSTSDVIVRTPHGITCTTLFNRFTIDDTPMLRGLVD
ncbi:MAG TPA: hypothetical protein VID30_17665 [Bradyrhizobium sp.]|jgi:hypothetical protein